MSSNGRSAHWPVKRVTGRGMNVSLMKPTEYNQPPIARIPRMVVTSNDRRRSWQSSVAIRDIRGLKFLVLESLPLGDFVSCYTCAMHSNALATAVVLVVLAPMTYAAPPVELELATERGVQITAPHEWLQLFTAIGIDNVRIRGMTPGDEAKVSNRGTAERPRYHVVGILTSRDQLRLPGETFTRGERARLKGYFERLTADGADSLTAPRGRFGLTEKEMAAVLADLSQPIDFETRGRRPRR